MQLCCYLTPALRRRMYDSILSVADELPSDVKLATVLENCTEAAAAGILNLLPITEGQLSNESLAPAG